jgi:hypothetical protein
MKYCKEFLMAFTKPFHRNYRQIVNGFNSGYSNWGYIIDHEYAAAPEHYTRAFLLIQNDMEKLFEYIEPADINLSTYSYRIHDLLVRTCIEIEANFKAIFNENIYSKNINNWNMKDYFKINKTHHLDDYSVGIPIWNGIGSTFYPFKEWKNNDSVPSWYRAYNNSKHDREQNFKHANFENLLNAIAGLFALLSSQFCTESFSTGGRARGIAGYDYYRGTFGIGNFFIINFPKNWSEDEMYDFNWSELCKEKNKFAKIDYDLL